MARSNVASQLEKIRAARLKLEREEKKLLSRTHDKALSQIVQIARNADLSADQIVAALGGKRKKTASPAGAKTAGAKSSLAGKKIAPKYRDPANPKNTWTGRGRTPAWVAALQAKGQLESALIKKA